MFKNGYNKCTIFFSGVIAEYFKNISQLKFNERPDYAKYRKLFKDAVEESGHKDEGNLEFQTEGKTYEIELELDVSSDAEVNVIVRKTKQ